MAARLGLQHRGGGRPRLGELLGRPVPTGVFAADMQVTLVNDGPVTVVIDSRLRE